MQYDSAEQASLRLGKTVIAYDGLPAFVEEVTASKGKLALVLMLLPKMKDRMVVVMDDPLLETQNLRLGYVNMPAGAVYVSRIPARQQRQGLCNSNVVVKASNGRNAGYAFNRVYTDPAFKDMFLGKYPTIREAQQMLLDSKPSDYGDGRIPESVAFSRRMALYRDHDLGFFELRYKCQRIAWGDPDNFNLPSEFRYLSELMHEEGITVR